jgi:integrase
MLSRPLYLSFASEEEGDRYVKKLEALLDRGIVPQELRQRQGEIITLRDAARKYLSVQAVPSSDKRCLAVVVSRIGATRLTALDYEWAESWVSGMKREHNLSPSTLRHHVGALARCLDWCLRRGFASLVINPLRQFPKRYASYNESDANAVLAVEGEPREDVERDRRLHPDEEARIRAILAGKKPAARQRAFELHWQGALECIFELALETAMRMREMYTLSTDQVSLPQRTVFLEKTKNGDKRQVPLSSIACVTIQRYEHQVGCPDFRFHDLRHEATSRLFERTRLSDIQISRITGHKDPRVLRRYSNLRGSDLAAQLW